MVEMLSWTVHIHRYTLHSTHNTQQNYMFAFHQATKNSFVVCVYACVCAVWATTIFRIESDIGQFNTTPHPNATQVEMEMNVLVLWNLWTTILQSHAGNQDRKIYSLSDNRVINLFKPNMKLQYLWSSHRSIWSGLIALAFMPLHNLLKIVCMVIIAPANIIPHHMTFMGLVNCHIKHRVVGMFIQSNPANIAAFQIRIEMIHIWRT